MPMQQSRVIDVVLPVMTIRNTFIDFVDEECEDTEGGQPARPRRRCASLPPQAKLPSEGAAAAAVDGDAGSTASWRSGSDTTGRWSDTGQECDSDDGSGSSRRCTSPDLWSDPGASDADTDSSASTRAAKSRVTLCLQDHIAAKKEEDVGAAGVPAAPAGSGRTPLRKVLRTPLKAGSRMFTPQAPPLPPEVCYVLSAAQARLASDPAVCDAKVSEGTMGGAVEVTAEVLASAPVSDESLLTRAKTALLEAAGRGTLVYVLGYGRQPFEDLGQGRFGCTLVMMPAEKQHLMCFDTCQYGSCPRAGTCRWCHPGPADLLKVVVHVRRLHAR